MGSAQHPTCPSITAPLVHSLISLPNPSNSSPWRQDPTTPSVNLACLAIWLGTIWRLFGSQPWCRLSTAQSPLHGCCLFGWGLRAPCSDSIGGLAKRWLPLSRQWLNSSYISLSSTLFSPKILHKKYGNVTSMPFCQMFLRISLAETSWLVMCHCGQKPGSWDEGPGVSTHTKNQV